MAIDPICGMTVDEKTAKFTSDYKGTEYYFCSPGCKKKFDAEPAKYAPQGNNPLICVPRSLQYHEERMISISGAIVRYGVL